MTKEERTSYFYIAVELLEQIYHDMNQEKFAEVEMLKRLFQFSKKTRSLEDMILDDHAPFGKCTYL